MHVVVQEVHVVWCNKDVYLFQKQIAGCHKWSWPKLTQVDMDYWLGGSLFIVMFELECSEAGEGLIQIGLGSDTHI